MSTLKKLIGQIRIFFALLKVLTVKTKSGADISVWDFLKPEENAMVQSLNSRSAGGFIENLKRVYLEGAKKFMASFYSGYGHKSIADCGSTQAAADGISMLAAKEIQNWQLYNGQETSTRYVDTKNLGYVDPVGTEASKHIMLEWFNFYKKAFEPTMAYLRILRPRKENEDEKKYAVMIEKRAYDVLGSFLPAGAKTNASCHMTLRQWDDKLAYSVHHPIQELQDVAKSMLGLLQEKYPSTFIKKKAYTKTEEYKKQFMWNFSYSIPQAGTAERVSVEQNTPRFHKNFQHDIILNEYRELFEGRPDKTEIPRILNEAASYRLEFLMDYRSHRDIQRQRSAIQRVPLLTTEFGFEEWYLNQMPEDLRTEALEFIRKQTERIANLTDKDGSPVLAINKQYYMAMGFKVYESFTVGLADLIYILELRTLTTVHPTVRNRMIEVYEWVKTVLPEFVTIQANTSKDDFDIKRADQDIFIGNKRVSETTQ